MSRRRPAQYEASSTLGMRGQVSQSPLPVYANPPSDYAGSDAAASHVWLDGAAASSPNVSFPTDWLNDVHPPGGYVNFLQNPASFPFPQQIPSRPDMAHNYHFTGSSQNTPSPATQLSATKKSQKGGSNKHTHTINLENGDDGEPSNKKRMSWTTKEDERLMGAWLNNSNDAISGNYKKNDQYWDAVTAEYNSNTLDNNRKRQMKQCMSRWHRVNKIVNDFHVVYTEISQVYSSGQNQADLMKKVQIKYEKDHGPFLHMDTWEACKNFPKWLAYNAEMHGSKKRDVADLGDVGVKSSPIGTDDIPRPPMGVKKAKAERDGKGKNKQLSKDMEELNKYIEAQEEASKNRTAVLEVQKRISQDKVEASRLALEAAKENKEAKTKAKMLEQYTKLLTHDTSGMPDDMKAEHLKAISLMRETLWGGNHQR